MRTPARIQKSRDTSRGKETSSRRLKRRGDNNRPFAPPAHLNRYRQLGNTACCRSTDFLQNVESQSNALNNGRRLPETTLRFFESRFGADLGAVKIHTGPDAANLAAGLNARAFTVANRIVFAHDQYAPNSQTGLSLIAHELTHTLQQTDTPKLPPVNTAGHPLLPMRDHGLQTDAPSLFREVGEGSGTTTDLDSEAEIVAWEIHDAVSDASSPQEIQSEVEARAGDLGFLGADAIVISFSGAGGYGIAGGAGFEAVWGPAFGWAFYFQAGIGLASPGAGVALEVGIIWDLQDPDDYTEAFIEVAITGGPGVLGYFPGMVSGSGSVTPDDVAELVQHGSMSRPRGIKVGGGYGTPGAQISALFEWYWLLSGQSPTGAGQEVSEALESAELEPDPPATVEPVRQDQIDTTVNVFVQTLSSADREGYRRVLFTVRRTHTELIPGFEKSNQQETLLTAQGEHARSDVRALVQIAAMNPVGRYHIDAIRDNSGWGLSFSTVSR